MEIDQLSGEDRSIFKNRPLLRGLLFYTAGIIFSTAFDLHYMYSLIFLLTALFGALYFYLKARLDAAGISLLVLLFILGWFRADMSQEPFPANHIANLAGQGVRAKLFGKIVGEPDIREDRTYLVMEADSATIRGYTIPSFGRVRLGVRNGGSRFDHSDHAAAEGYLYVPDNPRNPGGFDYARYLRTKNIFAAMAVSRPHNVTIIRKGSSFLSSVVKPARSYMISVAGENLSPVSSAILSGFILGERRDIPKEYETMFRDTGTLHLMAVSGSNVGMVIAVIAFPLTLLGLRRKRKVLLLLIAVAFFAVLTRLEPSVIRASIMASIGLLAYGWLRQPDYVNLLAFAGLIMLLWSPLQLFDVGLQLSFAATFGIVFVVPGTYAKIKPLTRGKRRWIRWMVIAFLTTMVAQAAVMPLMALYFNRFPLAGLLANMPIGILASLASTLGIALYFLAGFGGWPEWLLGRALEFILSLIQSLLGFFSDLPLTIIRTYSFSWPAIILYWIVLYMIYELISRRRLSVKAVIAGLVVFNLLIWPETFLKERRWTMDFVDVGTNRAWIYVNENGESLGYFDIYADDEFAERTLFPYILNFHGGRLDWAMTSTPESHTFQSIMELFSPRRLTSADSSSSSPEAKQGSDKNLTGHPDWIKFVWGESDNTEKGSYILPCARIETGNDLLLLAGRAGAGCLQNFAGDERITLLELPWSIYARTECKQAIERLNPKIVVFSPDRYSGNLPRRREDLTHSAERAFSTSIFGGFRVVEFEGEVWVDTMKPVKDKE
jgi:competence protein ComEC